MRHLVSLLLLLCLLACAGGATSTQRNTVALTAGAISAPKGYGVAIVSLALTTQDSDNTRANVILQGPQGLQTLSVLSRTDQILASGRQANPVGKVFVMTLPVGEYSFSQVMGEWRIYSKVSGGVRNFNLPMDQHFSVSNQGVVYLGSIDLDVSIRSELSYSNQWTRDQQDIAQRYQVTDFSLVKTQFLSTLSTHRVISE